MQTTRTTILLILAVTHSLGRLAADDRVRTPSGETQRVLGDLFGAIKKSSEIVSRKEREEWTRFAGLPEIDRIAGIRFGISNYPGETAMRARQLVHAVAGLDPGGRIRRGIGDEIKSLQSRSPAKHDAAELACLYLQREIRVQTPSEIAAAFARRMEAATDSFELAGLGFALVEMREELTPDDVRPAAIALFKRIATEPHGYAVGRMTKAMWELEAELGAEDARPIATAVVKRMQTEREALALGQLGNALTDVQDLLSSSELRPAAEALVNRMIADPTNRWLSSVCGALHELAKSLDAEEAQPLAAALVRHLETEDTEIRRYHVAEFASALASVSTRLDLADLRKTADAVVKRINADLDGNLSPDLGRALSVMSRRIGAGDVEALAGKVIDRIESSTDSFGAAQLGEFVATLAVQLPAEEVRRAARALMARLRSVPPDDVDARGQLQMLTFALRSLGPHLQPADLQPAGAELIRRMESGKGRRLADVLSLIAPWLAAEDLRPAIALLTARKVLDHDFVELDLLEKYAAKLTGGQTSAELDAVLTMLIEPVESDPGAGIPALWRLRDHLSNDQKGRIATRLQTFIESDSEDRIDLCDVWLDFTTYLGQPLSARLPAILEIIQSPDSLEHHKSILAALERCPEAKPTKFHGQVWKLVEWLETSEKFRSLRLKFDFRPH